MSDFCNWPKAIGSLMDRDMESHLDLECSGIPAACNHHRYLVPQRGAWRWDRGGFVVSPALPVRQYLAGVLE